MKATGEDRGAAARRGPAAIGRDLLLAVGLIGICAGGLALFLKTAEVAGSRGSGVPVAVLAALAALGVLAVGLAVARRRTVPVRNRARMRPAAPVDPDLPDVGTEALDHEAVDADGFEHTVAALCARDGCTPVEVVGGAGDLGADVVTVTADGRRVVLQCKHYAEDNRVGSQDLQRFGGTCFTVHEADVAVVVTTSSFTAPAVEYAATCGIICVDGEALAAWTDQIAPPPWDALSADPPAPGLQSTGSSTAESSCPS
ncbi:restriction endonuclease [Streptomyces sp. Je 1-79]|uniref:restriction endonuclease n=1 Tax=Streptomyces sp. Je 1-79 TaxID=2943847 RepID=UPI0021A96136|nr:restriction endonuclease [Streptomyces sp. Je 1-79]MCT4351779.1 restriction endonuclease [Streptomyces sp. Je 1-79]